MSKKVLVIGAGGREHAMIYALNKSNNVAKVYSLPGNAGIDKDSVKVDIKQDDFKSIADFCENEQISYVIVGPEQPLVDGIVDYLNGRGVKVFGPNKSASQIEGSKQFMKDLVKKYNIPTAEYETFEEEDSALKYIEKKGAPIVVKTDGLAAGKGVTVAMTKDEAINAVKEAFAGKFGDSGKKLVIEEFLEGEELSYFVVSDGKDFISLGSAQDHKAAFDEDKGPNTGGMGTYSPSPICTKSLEDKINETIIKPTIDGLAKDNLEYKGFLFAGLMIDKNGEPKLLEYNIRLGDPEAQVLMLRLNSDFSNVIESAIDGTLAELDEVKFSSDNAICVVMASKGYPESYGKGHKIDLSKVPSDNNIRIFHAGTAISNGEFISSGGRVLNVCALGESLKQAQQKAYNAINNIGFENSHYRKDIGW